MTSMYERYARSAIQTALLRQGYCVRDEPCAKVRKIDLLATPRTRLRNQRQSLAIDFRNVKRVPAHLEPTTVDIDGAATPLHRAYIVEGTHALFVDRELALALEGATGRLALAVR